MKILTDKAQKEFWDKIEPDVSELLGFFENKETWIYLKEELPELYERLARSLESIGSTDLHKIISKIDAFIPILASIPLRECIMILSYLDSISDESYRWGLGIYRRCHDLMLDEKHEHHDFAKVIIERVDIIIKLKISAELFSNITKKVEN